jgi:hypothetical protein
MSAAGQRSGGALVNPDYPFAIYCISFLPDNGEHRMERRDDLIRVIDWWKRTTSMPFTLIASNWQDLDFRLVDFAVGLSNVTVIHQPAQLVGLNRVAAFNAFYSSDHDWGVMIDDDAILMDSPRHNRGPELFRQMVANGSSAYEGVDLFFPIGPKKPGHNTLWAQDPIRYRDHHVFERNLDMKGSLFVVRNFRKEGKVKVMPDPTFQEIGEDRQIAIEAVSLGYTVMQNGNMVLKELGGRSHFPSHTKDVLVPGVARIINMYSSYGLKAGPKPHLFETADFYRKCWGAKKKLIDV